MNKPHIHKDTIIAWANGDQIQVQCDNGEWVDTHAPGWTDRLKFRVKPDVEADLIGLFSDLADYEIEFVVEQLMKKFNITLKD